MAKTRAFASLTGHENPECRSGLDLCNKIAVMVFDLRPRSVFQIVPRSGTKDDMS